MPAMKRQHKTAKSHLASGFTLIELLVVLIIIGILTAIALPIMLHPHHRTIDTQVCGLNGKNVWTAAGSFTYGSVSELKYHQYYRFTIGGSDNIISVANMPVGTQAKACNP